MYKKIVSTLCLMLFSSAVLAQESNAEEPTTDANKTNDAASAPDEVPSNAESNANAPDDEAASPEEPTEAEVKPATTDVAPATEESTDSATDVIPAEAPSNNGEPLAGTSGDTVQAEPVTIPEPAGSDVAHPPLPPPPPTMDREQMAAQNATSCPPGTPCLQAGELAIWPKLRLRTGYQYQQPDPDVLFIGQNDGFYLDQVRFGFGGGYKNQFFVRTVIDAVSMLPGGDLNDPVQPLIVSIVDAYLQYAPSQYFQLWLGQTFMPADREGTTSRSEMVFANRSVATDGVAAGRGYEVEGLSPSREMGLVLGAKDARVGPLSLDYRAAISNGNGPKTYGNDNKTPAGYFRLGAGYEGYFQVGLGGHYNPRTVGDVPNLYNELDSTMFGDMYLDAFGLQVLAQGIFRQTTFDSVFPEVQDSNRSTMGLGFTSSIVLDKPFGVSTFGLKPGYRFSYYDPTSSFYDDQLMEHALALRYDPETYDLPIALILDFTSLIEMNETGFRQFDNNRFTAIVQFNL